MRSLVKDCDFTVTISKLEGAVDQRLIIYLVSILIGTTLLHVRLIIILPMLKMNQKFVGFDQKQCLVLHYDRTGSESIWIESQPTTEDMLSSSHEKPKKKTKKSTTSKAPEQPVANISTKPSDVIRVATQPDSRGLSLSRFSYSPQMGAQPAPSTSKRKREGNSSEHLPSRKHSRLGETSARSSFQVVFYGISFSENSRWDYFSFFLETSPHFSLCLLYRSTCRGKLNLS